MRQSAIRLCVTLMLTVWGSALGPTISAASDTVFAVHDPEIGYQLTAAVKASKVAANRDKFVEAIEEAASEYRNANFSLAADWYENALKTAPGDPTLKNDIQFLISLSESMREVKNSTRRSLPIGEKRDEIFARRYSEAKRGYKAKRYSQAYSDFQQLWILTGDYKGTLKYLRKSWEKNGSKKPASTEAFLQQIAAVGQGAAEESDIPVRNAEEQIESLVLQAQMLRDSGNFSEALDIYTEALSLDPDNRVVARGLRTTEERRAQEQDRERISKIQTLTEIGGAYEKREDWDSARGSYETALALDPESESLQESIRRVDAPELTVSVQDKPVPDEIVIKIEEADKEQVERTDEEIELADALREASSAYQRADFESAEKAYRRALRIDPSSNEANGGLKVLKLAMAEEQARQRGDRVMAAVGQAESLVASGQYDRAKVAYQAVFVIDPENEQAIRGLNQVETLIETEREVARISSLDSQMEGIWDAVEAGDYAWSRAQLGSIIDRDPGYRPASEALAEIARLEQRELERQSREQIVVNLPPPPEVSAEESADLTSWEPISTSADYESYDSRSANSYEIAQAEPEEMASDSDAERAAPVRVDAARVEQLLSEADRKVDSGDIVGAWDLWQEVLELDPGNGMAQANVDIRRAQYESELNTQTRRESEAGLRQIQAALLSSPLTIQTDRPTPLSDFMRLISFSTTEELEYYIAEGSDTDIHANFVDRPLRDVLDSILRPKGLTWSISENNLITIELDLKHEAYSLSPPQVSRVRALLDSGQIQKVVWGQATPPAEGVEINLDERQRILLIVGSDSHLQKLDDLLSTIETIEAPELEVAIYRISEKDGPKIKSLINAVVSDGGGTPFEIERRVFIDGADLIVKDTPENIIKIEELLLDNEFIEGLRREELEIANFSLVPRKLESSSPEQIEKFTTKVIEAIDTLLYSQTGREAARAEGRRNWYDPFTYQLTVIDTPTNISRIGNFIASLPELKQRRQQRVIYLEHAVAEVIASELVAILDLRRKESGFETGEQVVARLRRGELFTFRDLRIRVIRVEDGDPDDRLDDEVQLNIISGTQSSTITVRELNTVFFEDIEITAEEIQPSVSGAGGTGVQGEGIARLLFRFLSEEEIEDEEDEDDLEELDEISVLPFGPLNALIFRFENPALFNDALELIQELDQPTPQVEVETKFVQVNENRAREFSADFSLDNLMNGGSLNTDFWQLNSRFAQSQDDRFNLGDIPLESPFSSDLIRGTTILDLVLGDGLPGISFELRLLEAEGVLNITNGPRVTMMDGIEGEFRIEKFGPQGTSTRVPRSAGDVTLQVVSDFDTDDGTLVNEDSSRFNNRIDAVILLVTPEITSEKSIIFDVTAEILDLDTLVGETLTFSVEPVTDFTEIDQVPAEFRNLAPVGGQMLTRGMFAKRRKFINTTARIEDGGTIVLGGWTGERIQESTSGVPVLRNMPYIGRFLFSRNMRSSERTTLVIFLTGHLVD